MEIVFRGKKIMLYKLVERYEMDPIELEDGDSFSYTMDVYRELSGERKYFPRVYRREFYRLKPSFASNTESDEEILIEDMARPWAEIRLGSSEEVVQLVLREIESIFDLLQSVE